MTSIFLSYARGDDEPFVARLSADLKSRGIGVWWDRADMPSRGLTFHQEIKDAIHCHERLVFVVGPKSVTSDYVNQEWRFALDDDKVVTPILRLGDYPLVPDELKLLHCEDFRDDSQYEFHLANLVRQLSEAVLPLGKLIAVPSLPPHYLARVELLEKLRDAVRADLDRPVVIEGAAARVGMEGMGGIGKSVVAAALVRDRKVREAFPDGIVWIGLGSLPDLRARMEDVLRELGADAAVATEHEGTQKLNDLLKDKAVLLVIDDVWRRGDIDAFDVLGPRCRALITTRDAGLITALGGVHHLVELLTEAEGLRLLAVAAGAETDSLPAEAHEVLAECGRLPLAVALAGGMIRAGTPWRDLREALRDHELEFIEDRHAANEQHVNLWRTIEVSVQALDEHVQQRLAELAAFPSDEQVPDAAVCTLWQHTGNLSPRHSRKLLVDLKQRSLVQLSSSAETMADSVGKVSLHDLIHDYCIRRATHEFGDEAALHTRLLDAYRRACPNGWWTGPNDGYFFDHLRQHLLAAGRAGELADLLQELRWLEAKNEAGLTFDLAHDLFAAVNALPERDERRKILRLLDEALRRDIQFIHRHREDYPQSLFQCLWNHGWWYDCPEAAQHYADAEGPWNSDREKMYPLLERWRGTKERALPGILWIRSLRPPAIHLDSALRAVLRGHKYHVASVVFSPDGRRIASGSWDNTIRVWDAVSGAQIRLLNGHDASVTSVAFSPDGRQIVSGSIDKTVRVWDTENGVERRVLRGHEDPVSSVVFSHNGRWIASGAKDKVVRVWDAESGAGLRMLRGHEDSVTSVMFSHNGRWIASSAEDKTVRMWEFESGAELRVLRGHDSKVTSVAFSPDDLRIVSGSWDDTVRVWDAESGLQLCALRGHHKNLVTSVAFSPNGRRIASGSMDTTVRVWDAESGEELRILRGHEGSVTSVAFSPDARQIVSGAEDKTVRVWDAESGAKPRMLRGHELVVTSMAFSPDGQRVVSGAYDDTVRLWDTTSGTERRVFREHEGPVETVAISPDGRQIASGSWDKTIRVWDAESGAQLHVLRGHQKEVISVAFSSDGRRIASGALDNTVRVWDALSGADLRVLRGHEFGVRKVAFSSDGQRIEGGSIGKAAVWNAESGEILELVEGWRQLVKKKARTQERFAYRAIAREDETVLESTETGQPIGWFPIAMHQIATHPDGRMWAGVGVSHVNLFQLEGTVTESCRPNIEQATRQRVNLLVGTWLPVSVFARPNKEGELRPEPLLSQSSDFVHFSAFLPTQVRPGTMFVLEVWAYLDSQREEVLAFVKSKPQLEETGKAGPLSLIRGTAITLNLVLPNFEVPLQRQTLWWTGTPATLGFVICAPNQPRQEPYPGWIEIIRDRVPVATIPIQVVFSGETATTKQEVVADYVRTIFASYAEEDRPEVLLWARGARDVGVDVFLDVVSLRAGQDWEKVLWAEVPSRDRFCLFWTMPASKSEWVEKEWRCALSKRGIDYIRPIPFVDPRDVPPPPELAASKHFNDLLWMVYEYERQRRKSN